MSTPRPPRLQDIADQAGLSKATVSLALRNHPSIPPPTRTRIQKLAEQMGYRPNPLVSALMAYQRTTQAIRPTGLTLAVVIDFPRSTSTWRQYLSEDLLAAAGARARELGYNIEEL